MYITGIIETERSSFANSFMLWSERRLFDEQQTANSSQSNQCKGETSSATSCCTVRTRDYWCADFFSDYVSDFACSPVAGASFTGPIGFTGHCFLCAGSWDFGELAR